MKTHLRVYLLILLTVTACSSVPAGNPPVTPIEASAPTPNIPLPFTATSIPTTTAAPTRTSNPESTPGLVQTRVPVKPLVEFRCPAQPEVSLADLGLNLSTRLVVRPPKEYSSIEWGLAGSNLKPQHIRATVTDGIPFPTLGGISPNGRWLAFFTEDKDNRTDDLWISSIDGQNQWRVLNDLEHAYGLRWVNDQTIVLFHGPLGYHWPVTSLRLDPFTLETVPLAPVYLEFGVYAFSPDAFQVIYIDRYLPYSWKRYDFETNTTQTVLPSIGLRHFALPFQASVHWATGGVSVAVTGAPEMELVVNLPPTTLGQRNESVWEVSFPGEGWDYSDVNWWSSDSQLIGVVLKSGEGDPSASRRQFYILDTAHWVLYDYCLPEELNPGQIYSSADEHFLAWSASDSGIQGTVVMELATGRRAWLPDLEVIGWGELDGK